MSNQTVRIGIAGCGWIAEKAHIPAFRCLEGVKICSLFDVDGYKAENISTKYHIRRIYDHYDEFLNSGIDAVVIATPNDTHVEYSIRALERGIHVLCEKPAAITTAEILSVVKAAENNHGIYVPGFVNRFRYDIGKMREMVSQNEIGDIISVKAGWLRKSGMPRPGTWFTNKLHSGGGVLIDLGSHVIDICSMFFENTSPTGVSLSTRTECKKVLKAGAEWFSTGAKNLMPIDVEDTAIGTIKLSADKSIEFELSWSAPVKADCTYFTITGTQGEIKLKTLFGFSNDRLWDKDSLRIRDRNSEDFEIPVNREINSTSLAFYDMARFFVNVIRGKAQHAVTEQDALKNVDIIEALYKSEDKMAPGLEKYVPRL